MLDTDPFYWFVLLIFRLVFVYLCLCSRTKSDPAGQQKRRAALGESLQEQLHATELRQRTAQHEKDVFLAAKRKATEDSRMIEY